MEDDEKKITQIDKKKRQAELEKEVRDNLDEVCKECRDMAQAEEEDDEDFPEEWIRSPVPGEEFLPMVIMFAGNFKYIGGFGYGSDADPARLIMYNPLLFAEMASEDGRGGHQIAPAMNKLFFTLGLVDQISLRCDNLIFLKSKNMLDRKIVQMYGEIMKKLSAEDVGIISPTLDDITNLSGMPPRGRA